MCGFSWIASTEYIKTGKSLLDYNNLFFSNGYKKKQQDNIEGF